MRENLLHRCSSRGKSCPTGIFPVSWNSLTNKQTNILIDLMLLFIDDGYIDFNEYVDMMRKNYVTIDIERERMKAAFSLLDNDGDGLLSRQELMDALVTKSSGITIEDVEEILRDADMDGNEHIDFNGN